MFTRSRLKAIFLILTGLVAFETYHFLRTFFEYSSTYQFAKQDDYFVKTIKPFCNCSAFIDEYILIEKRPDTKFSDFLVVSLVKENLMTGDYPANTNDFIIKTFLFNITQTQLNSFVKTCDLYNVLRRGLGQKIISYSLYGTKPKYSQNLEGIADIIRLKYSGYTARVYYDSSVNETIRCHLECEYPDIIDFCNMNKFSTGVSEMYGKSDRVIDMTYMHKMMWRFLPSGDSFVDVFMSRDTDSFFTDREVDAVNEWLSSNKTGHIMRGLFFFCNKII